MKRITILAAWLNLLFTGLATAQTTITVRQDGSGDYTTIQAAIDAAASGDTIAVYPGTYIENIYFYRKYRITLRSTDPTSPAVVAATIIDGNRAGPVVLSVDPDTTGCVLSGFTIRNGSAREEGGGIQGWAWFTYQTHAVIENNVITGNAAHCGGGLFGFNGTIQNNTITRNSAARDGGALNRCYGTIQNNTITSNSAARSGGALETCHGTVQNNVVVGNSAGLDGGGLAVCSGTIRNNVIVGNSARSSGGASLAVGEQSKTTQLWATRLVIMVGHCVHVGALPTVSFGRTELFIRVPRSKCALRPPAHVSRAGLAVGKATLATIRFL